jgi:hypothetical protein
MLGQRLEVRARQEQLESGLSDHDDVKQRLAVGLQIGERGQLGEQSNVKMLGFVHHQERGAAGRAYLGQPHLELGDGLDRACGVDAEAHADFVHQLVAGECRIGDHGDLRP